MPTARIDTPGVTVELTASEASIEALGKQALELFKDATEIHNRTPTGPAFGFTGEKRWTPDHHDLNHHRDWIAPVHAQEGGTK